MASNIRTCHALLDLLKHFAQFSFGLDLYGKCLYMLPKTSNFTLQVHCLILSIIDSLPRMCMISDEVDGQSPLEHTTSLFQKFRQL